MKKTSPSHQAKTDDDLRPKYDCSGGVRGKYAKCLRERGYTVRVYHRDGTFSERYVLADRVVTLEPDIQEYFPDSKAVTNPHTGWLD